MELKFSDQTNKQVLSDLIGVWVDFLSSLNCAVGWIDLGIICNFSLILRNAVFYSMPTIVVVVNFIMLKVERCAKILDISVSDRFHLLDLDVKWYSLSWIYDSWVISGSRQILWIAISGISIFRGSYMDRVLDVDWPLAVFLQSRDIGLLFPFRKWIPFINFVASSLR